MPSAEERQPAPLQRPYPSLAVNGNCSSSATYESVPGDSTSSNKTLTESARKS